jgi:hypothetical protein
VAELAGAVDAGRGAIRVQQEDVRAPLLAGLLHVHRHPDAAVRGDRHVGDVALELAQEDLLGPQVAAVEAGALVDARTRDAGADAQARLDHVALGRERDAVGAAAERAGHRPGRLAGLGHLDLEGRLVAVLVLAERGDHLDMARAVVDGALHRELAHEHILAGAGQLAHIDAVPLHEHRRGVLGVYGDWHRAGGVDLGWQLDRHDLRQDGLVAAGLARRPGLARAQRVGARACLRRRCFPRRP